MARTLDAAKLVLRRGPWQVDLVSASVASPQTRGLSHHLEGNSIHFAYGRRANPIPNAALEPYFIWRVGRGNGDSLAGITPGSPRRRCALRGRIPLPLELCNRMACANRGATDQFGYETIRAFAEHSQLRYTFDNTRFRPRVIGEFNYASGDADPNDHRAGTFDQMFPTPHEKYGLADQVGWQNIEHISAGVECNPSKKLILRFLAHDWYLARARDGVYAAGGGLLFRDLTGQSGRHVGEELDVRAQYDFGPNYIGGGYGHLFPGEFVKSVSPGAGLNYLYLNVGYRF